MAPKKTGKKERITPRDAAVAAAEYYRAVSGSPAQSSPEEIELNRSGNRWLVTLGINEGPFLSHKAYKVFEVDAYTGEVLSMKIRGIG